MPPIPSWYQTQVRTRWRATNATATFYWETELTDPDNSWAVAADIQQTILSFDEWLFRFSWLIGNDAGIVGLATRRVFPAGNATYRQGFGGGGIQGQFPSPVCVTNEAVKFRWFPEQDRKGKHQVRIGPMPAGATRSVEYWDPFYAACVAFGNVHIGTHISPFGREFTASVRNGDGTFSRILRGSVNWPPSWASKRGVKVR